MMESTQNGLLVLAIHYSRLHTRMFCGTGDNTVQNEQQNTCRDAINRRLYNPKLLPVALNPSVLERVRQPSHKSHYFN